MYHRCSSAFSIGQAYYGIMQRVVVKGIGKSDTHAIMCRCKILIDSVSLDSVIIDITSQQ